MCEAAIFDDLFKKTYKYLGNEEANFHKISHEHC